VTRRALHLTVVLLLVTGACGVRADHDPQAIAPQDVPGQLLDPNPSSSTTLPESGATTVPVYLLQETADGVHLVAVKRGVAEAGKPDERLAALFRGAQPEEIEKGLTTGIPADTELLDVSTDEEGAEVTIDISDDLFSIEGEALAHAFAQMVWTATEPEAGGFRQVRFSVNGEPTTVLDGNGAEQEGAVTRGDYDALSPLQ
jgi:spore germination protein GerM